MRGKIEITQRPTLSSHVLRVFNAMHASHKVNDGASKAHFSCTGTVENTHITLSPPPPSPLPMNQRLMALFVGWRIRNKVMVDITVPVEDTIRKVGIQCRLGR